MCIKFFVLLLKYACCLKFGNNHIRICFIKLKDNKQLNLYMVLIKTKQKNTMHLASSF